MSICCTADLCRDVGGCAGVEEGYPDAEAGDARLHPRVSDEDPGLRRLRGETHAC